MPAQDKPRAEVAVDEALVRALLTDQHPDLADEPLTFLTEGWDNAILRLGAERVVRLPRRELAAELVRHEQQWLPVLAPDLPVPVPVPERVGRPGRGYPWSWSVCPWFAGELVGTRATAGDTGLARQLGAFLAALHRPAPPEAPANPFRGGPLADRAEVTEQRLAVVADLVAVAPLRPIWDAALAARPWSGPPSWVHGDLHPANLLVDDGHLSAVLDFGDLTAGDPATDLAVAWMLFDDERRAILRAGVGGVDDDTWVRARGWALSLAVAYLERSADVPLLAAVGRRTLDAVVGDPGR